MQACLVERARRWLAEPLVRHAAPGIADRLARALARGEEAMVRPTAHGGLVCFLAGRRALELDRGGTLVAALDWADDGVLASALVRSAAGDLIAIEPRADPGAVGSASAGLRRVETPGSGAQELLTVFEAPDWSRVTRIPTLAEPARLPPGAGTAVLNLLAQLARDQGVERVRYRGPFPTEALFLALLESFRFDEEDSDPLRRFLDGGLDWAPAPHERHHPRPGTCVQLRTAVEKVVWRGRAYYRDEWQSVRRHAPCRVRDAEGGVRCSLWALGVPIEDHLVLDAEGDVVMEAAPPPDPRPPAALGGAVVAGLAAVVRATSAPALTDAIDAAMAGLAFEWAGLSGDLAELAGARARISWRLADVGAARLRAATTPADRLGRALELVTEMARLLADQIRARAQAALAGAPPEAQEAALDASPAPARDARAIAEAAAALAERFAQ